MGEQSGCVAVLYGISAGQKVHIPNESLWTVLHSGQEHTSPHKHKHTHYSFWRQCYEPYSPVCPLHWWVQCRCIMSLQPCILMSKLLPASFFFCFFPLLFLLPFLFLFISVFQSCSTYVICCADFCNLIKNSLSWSLLINKAVKQYLKSTQCSSFREKSNPLCFQFKTWWFYN